MRTTSPSEGNHYHLKKNLPSRRIGFKVLFEEISRFVHTQRARYAAQTASEKARTRLHFQQYQILNGLRYAITFKALELLAENCRLVVGSLRDQNHQLRACTHTFRAQMGLPCQHEVLVVSQAGRFFTLADIDPHWHLTHELVIPILPSVILLNLTQF